MTLPQETIEKIEADSLKYLSSLYNDSYVERRYEMKSGVPYEWKAIRKAHKAGATEWAGMAQGLVDALKWIQMHTPIDQDVDDVITGALAKYKEVSE